MNRIQKRALSIVSLASALFSVAPARAAVTQLSRTTWGASGVPSYVNMYIYVPEKLASKPAIVVACHSCGTAVEGYVNSIKGIQAAADKNGFVLILPEATKQNCWDVGSNRALTRDGGGDTQAVLQMVKYAITQYKADPERVYIMGGSSGAMMTQAMAAVYPDIFKAAAARAGVPAGCWADGYDSDQQWSNNCAGGTTTKTAMQWGDLVREINPSYKGHRPRMQLFHGTADTTISFNNFGEAIKEWTDVLALSATPTSMDRAMTSVSTYDRQTWKNACGATVLEAWAGNNGTHSMAYEEDAILAFFGLDKVDSLDPEANCSAATPGSSSSAATSGSAKPPASSSAGAAGSGAAGSPPFAVPPAATAGTVASTSSNVAGMQPPVMGPTGAVPDASQNVAGSNTGSVSGASTSPATVGAVGTSAAAPSHSATDNTVAISGQELDNCAFAARGSKSDANAAWVGLALLALRRRRSAR